MSDNNMNENLNLVKILRDCPKDTILYSPMYGEVRFLEISENTMYPIRVITINNRYESFTPNGRLSEDYKDAECILFPSKNQRDWSKFKVDIKRFDSRELKPFDKVLVRDNDTEYWDVNFYSHLRKNVAVCMSFSWKQCIPYNDNTKHLVDTIEDCPEYYKWWKK